MVTKLCFAEVVMAEASFTLRYGILTTDVTRQFNSIVAIVEDVALWFVTDVEVMGIWLSTISLRSRVIVRCCMIQTGFALIVPQRLIEDMTMATTAILLARTSVLIVTICIMYTRRSSRTLYKS